MAWFPATLLFPASLTTFVIPAVDGFSSRGGEEQFQRIPPFKHTFSPFPPSCGSEQFLLMVALDATNFSLETWKVEQIYVSEMFDLAMRMG